MFGDNGGLRHHNTRTRVLKLGIDADVLALAEPLPVNLSADGHLAVRYEHTSDLLLFGGGSRSLRESEAPGQRSVKVHTYEHNHDLTGQTI